MHAIDLGPLWPTAAKPVETERCVLRLPPWIALPADVDPADVRVERRGRELVLVVRR